MVCRFPSFPAQKIEDEDGKENEDKEEAGFPPVP
jgi:hypothetical protein